MTKKNDSKWVVNFEKYRCRLPGLNHLIDLHRTITRRVVWPYSMESDSLYRWRAYILSAILLSALIFGSAAFIAAMVLIVKENAWGLAIVDFSGIAICLLFLVKDRIHFKIRAVVTLLCFFVIGVSVIFQGGPLSGGPAWLFAFAVLAGVLIGDRAAGIAIAMNLIFLGVFGGLIFTGKLGSDFPVFRTDQAMLIAGINFIMLNAITAVSVSALLNALNNSEKRYRLIAQNVADVIWTMDMGLKFTYISPSVEQMLGYTASEAMEKNMDQVIAPESLERVVGIHQERLALIRRQDETAWESFIFEAFHLKKDGSRILANIHCRCLKGPDNTPLGFLGVSRDITARKKMEQDKIQAQIAAWEHKKLALVGQIAGKMAHDFNNVLGVIMGQSEMAMMDCRDPHQKNVFELIFNQTLRGRNLTKNLIAFAQSSEPKQKYFYLYQKVEFVLDLFRNDLEGIHLIQSYADDIEVLADPGMIEHAIVNLVQNSIHAVCLIDKPVITLKTYCSSDHIVFEIRDNGCGIPGDQQLHIFDPSFTLKGSKDVTCAYKQDIKGSGYGLANVKKYIEMHRGTVHVTSQVGDGTAFCIRLPIIKKELSHTEIEILENASVVSKKRVLLVEDEMAISEVQQHVLSHDPCCHLVDVAATGEDAIRLFDEKPYDLISLDYILPGRLNGMDVYTHIRNQNSSIPIIFVSGNIEFLESINRLKFKDLSIDHISKPCRNIDYIRRINILLNSKIRSKEA